MRIYVGKEGAMRAEEQLIRITTLGYCLRRLTGGLGVGVPPSCWMVLELPGDGGGGEGLK